MYGFPNVCVSVGCGARCEGQYDQHLAGIPSEDISSDHSHYVRNGRKSGEFSGKCSEERCELDSCPLRMRGCSDCILLNISAGSSSSNDEFGRAGGGALAKSKSPPPPDSMSVNVSLHAINLLFIEDTSIFAKASITGMKSSVMIEGQSVDASLCSLQDLFLFLLSSPISFV